MKQRVVIREEGRERWAQNLDEIWVLYEGEGIIMKMRFGFVISERRAHNVDEMGVCHERERAQNGDEIWG